MTITPYDILEAAYFPITIADLKIALQTEESQIINYIEKLISKQYIKALHYNPISDDYIDENDPKKENYKEYKFVITRQGLLHHHTA